jgi:CHAT domain-containing protein/tetratricopeptide (TPR) repeat protein
MRRILAISLAFWAAAAAAEQMTPAQETAWRSLVDLSGRIAAARTAGDLASAEALARESLSLVETALPDAPLARASALLDLAAVMAAQGRLSPAEAMARSALDLRQANGGDAAAVAAAERLLAEILAARGDAAGAQALADSAAGREAAPPPPASAADTPALAVAAAERGEIEAALDLLRTAEAALPGMTPAEAARTFRALGRVQSLAGRPYLAEAAYREALRRSQDLAGDPAWTAEDHALALNNLAAVLAQAGRTGEAMPLFAEAAALADGRGDPLVLATVLDGLADTLRAAGEYQGAFDAGRRALDLRLQALPGEDPRLSASFAALGWTLLAAGEVQIAAQSLTKALAIAEAAGDATRAARAAMMLATAEAMLGQPAFDRAARAGETMAALLPPGDPRAAQALFNAAWIGLSEGRPAEALPLARTALDAYAGRVQRVGVDAASSGDAAMRRQVLALTTAAWETDPEALIGPAFQAAQWAVESSAGRSTQRMTARFAAGGAALSDLVRRRQDLVDRWQAADRQWLAAFEDGGATPVPATAALEAEIAALDAELAQRFPEYSALTTRRALDLAETQARLAPDETLLFLVPTPDGTYVFAVTADGAGWHRADLTDARLTEAVALLRADLDPTGPVRAAVALNAPPAARGKGFDRGLAHDLYTALLAPVAPHLRGRLLVAADGALTALPLAVLVASPPAGADDDPAALAATDWLAARHALVTLPAVPALASLRDLPRPAVAAGGFAGFGAPDFAGEGRPPAVAAAFDGPRARAEALRALAPLPGTRRELLGLARRLGAAESDLRLGPAATEAAVKAADLTGARILAFATHGLIAGDIAGLAEPALAFSPPAAPGEADDGLLTASEVAQLRLAADWVILSACNTAAGDGTPGAEGLSGLASAFLYAGARGLLVSHWPVGDAAAERLTQEAVARLAADPAAGQAGALAAAMAALRGDPAFAHPSAWAPFVVVGDGR